MDHKLVPVFFLETMSKDVLVLNYPYGRNEKVISFKINYVCIKRCLGCPGDTISIKDGKYLNSNVVGSLGNQYYQRALHHIPDSTLYAYGFTSSSIFANTKFGWNIKNFGPLYVPKKGDTIVLDREKYSLYEKLIMYEMNLESKIIDYDEFIENLIPHSYTFKTNWYFVGGDNVLNSKDSRYIGLIPEEYIIGVVRTKN